MAQTILVEEKLRHTADFLAELEKSGLTLDAAFWTSDLESGNWRLVLAMPEVDKRGPRHVYSRIQQVLASYPISITLDEVSVVSPNSELVSLLKKFVRADADAAMPMEFTGNVINGVRFPDALIYRV